MRNEIVIDIDGTLTLPRIGDFERFLTPFQSPLVAAGLAPEIGLYFYNLKPNMKMIEWIKNIPADYSITMLTGRYNAFDYITRRWLLKYGILFNSLVFTPFGEKDIQFKIEYARAHESRIALMIDNMRHIRDGVAEIIGDRSVLWTDLTLSPAAL